MAFTPQIFSALQNIFCVLSISTMTYIVTAFSFLDLYNTFNEMSCSCPFSPKSRLSELWKTGSHDTSLFNIPGWTHFLLEQNLASLPGLQGTEWSGFLLPHTHLQSTPHHPTTPASLAHTSHTGVLSIPWKPKLIYIVGSLFFLLILPGAGPSDQIKCSNV